jgi:GDP-L-fucose synthase
MNKPVNSDKKVFVAGAGGMVGSAIVRQLQHKGYTRILAPSHAQLELTDFQAVSSWMAQNKPDYVFLAAARVGGILANDTFPAEFIYQNLMIQTHLIHHSRIHGVEKLIFLGSSCIYPRDCPQPMKENHLLSGPLEPTNSAYAVAKIAGIEMCWACNRQYNTAFLPVMPTNLYGPGDNFDTHTSHVLPAMIRKFHDARSEKHPFVTLWGSGTPRREFFHVDDLARACVFLMENDHAGVLDSQRPLVNIGTGQDIPIHDLALMVKEIVGFSGQIHYDSTKPDGTPRKLLDVSLMTTLGWKPDISLKTGIQQTYHWFLDQIS